MKALPTWIPTYGQDHQRLDWDVRRSLLSASAECKAEMVVARKIPALFEKRSH